MQGLTFKEETLWKRSQNDESFKVGISIREILDGARAVCKFLGTEKSLLFVWQFEGQNIFSQRESKLIYCKQTSCITYLHWF